VHEQRETGIGRKVGEEAGVKMVVTYLCPSHGAYVHTHLERERCLERHLGVGGSYSVRSNLKVFVFYSRAAGEQHMEVYISQNIIKTARSNHVIQVHAAYCLFLLLLFCERVPRHVPILDERYGSKDRRL